jgi:hypothetical protein
MRRCLRRRERRQSLCPAMPPRTPSSSCSAACPPIRCSAMARPRFSPRMWRMWQTPSRALEHGNETFQSVHLDAAAGWRVFPARQGLQHLPCMWKRLGSSRSICQPPVRANRTCPRSSQRSTVRTIDHSPPAFRPAGTVAAGCKATVRLRRASYAEFCREQPGMGTRGQCLQRRRRGLAGLQFRLRGPDRYCLVETAVWARFRSRARPSSGQLKWVIGAGSLGLHWNRRVPRYVLLIRYSGGTQSASGLSSRSAEQWAASSIWSALSWSSCSF